RPGGLRGIWAWLTNSRYRKARKAICALRTAGPAPAGTLFAELEKAQQQAAQWAAWSQTGSVPCRIADFATHQKNSEVLFADTAAIASVFSEKQIEQLTLDELNTLLAQLAADQSTPQRLPKLTQIERDLDAAGVGRLIGEIREQKPDSRLWPLMFQY